MNNFLKKEKFSNLIWTLFFLYVVFQALIVYLNFNSEIVDVDQFITADQAKWMSKGHFFETNVYGSNYIVPLDAYLSSLIIPFGFNPLTVVQLCNSAFFYLPFLYITKFFSNKFLLFRLSVISLALFLPAKFLIVSHMARSFTTITSISALSILYCLLENKNRLIILDLLLGSIFGITIASNYGTLFLSPLLLLFSKKRTVIIFAVGSIIGYFFTSLLQEAFMTENIEVNALNFSLSISSLDPKKISGYFLDNNIRNVLISLLLPGLSIKLILHFICKELPLLIRIKSWLVFSFMIFLIILSFMTNKPGDYTPLNPFYAVERLYVALPYFYITLFAHIGKYYSTTDNLISFTNKSFFENKKPFLVALVFLFIINLNSTFKFILVNKEPMLVNPPSMQVVKLTPLKKACLILKEDLKNDKNHYFVYGGPFGRDDGIVYGCSAIFDIPITQNVGEKRAWIKDYFESLGLKEKVSRGYF